MSPQRLGQNFLADDGWRRRIAAAVLGNAGADAALTKPGGVWIEIGAGHGEMTGYLAPSADRVVAIELDPLLLPTLSERVAPLGNVAVVAGDVLKLDLGELAAVSGETPRFRVYGNLPYYITSPIVHRILECPGMIEAFLVVQLEVAERMVAPPGSRARGYLSAFVEFYSRAEILLRIPPGAFRPRPKVTSALVALRPPGARAQLTPPVGMAAAPAFLDFLKACFAQKRKTLRNNLRVLASAARAEQAFELTGVRPGARAEQLTLEELARLFAAFDDAP